MKTIKTPIKKEDDCGCAPSDSGALVLPRRLAPVTRRNALLLGIAGVAGTGILLSSTGRAFAAEYPSWEDVEAAKSNEAAKAAEVANIQNLINQLVSEVARTQAEAEAASNVFYEAQQAFFDAARIADELQAEADAQAATAVESAQKAARVAAQLYRQGGDNTSLELFFSGSAATADDLLSRLGSMDKLLGANQSIYADAVTARDSAQSLSDQAQVARAERDRLQQVANEAMIAAQVAADAAAVALAAQEANLANLQAQLAALQDTTAKTIADYQAGVEAARIAREAAEARARAEAEAASALARAQAEAAAGGGGGGGDVVSGGGGGGGGVVGSSGWSRPHDGSRTSGYGPRTVQCGNSYCSSGYHYGVDFANGCYTSIYAAAAGTVVYSGYNGGYGNYIKIDHGNGVSTGYAHISNGGLWVGRGAWVESGQAIAATGQTGNSFGCHLHFEVYINGGTTNPINFMADRGVWV